MTVNDNRLLDTLYVAPLNHGIEAGTSHAHQVACQLPGVAEGTAHAATIGMMTLLMSYDDATWEVAAIDANADPANVLWNNLSVIPEGPWTTWSACTTHPEDSGYFSELLHDLRHSYSWRYRRAVLVRWIDDKPVLSAPVDLPRGYIRNDSTMLHIVLAASANGNQQLLRNLPGVQEGIADVVVIVEQLPQDLANRPDWPAWLQCYTSTSPYHVLQGTKLIRQVSGTTDAQVPLYNRLAQDCLSGHYGLATVVTGFIGDDNGTLRPVMTKRIALQRR